MNIEVINFQVPPPPEKKIIKKKIFEIILKIIFRVGTYLFELRFKKLQDVQAESCRFYYYKLPYKYGHHFLDLVYLWRRRRLGAGPPPPGWWPGPAPRTAAPFSFRSQSEACIQSRDDDVIKVDLPIRAQRLKFSTSFCSEIGSSISTIATNNGQRLLNRNTSYPYEQYFASISGFTFSIFLWYYTLYR